MNPPSPFNHLAQKKRAPALPHPPPTPTVSAGKGIAFQGDIGVIALDNIFQLFDFAALSGKLEVHSPANKGSFYFKEGVLIFGMLHISRRKIGKILLEAQMLTEEQLQECLLLHKQTRPQRQFGQILMEQGYLDPAGLNDTLSRQIKESFFEALSWQQGTFTFYHNQTPPPDVIQLQERVDHLLLEGMVYLDNTATLEP